MKKDKKTESNTSQNRYKWIYDGIISKVYDPSLKIGLSIFGEKRLRTHLINLILPFVNPYDTLLDICCGTGTLTTMLTNSLSSDCKIIGVDLSKGQIIEASKKNHYSNLEFKLMNASNLKFASETFNVVIISAALHEMNKVLRYRVLCEVYRVLKREGYLFIFDHHEPSELKFRLLYNLYLGFWEKLLSHSSEMQHNILNELKDANFTPTDQIIFDKKFYKFFQLIISKK
ncbi:MAG: class I SAM-dependent methyltransferase [Candidatus Lokiarchaeota archaeon]|nr:class I SAM-dependent methyltransferase [Candidatus Lokiarchaeota archaeon]